jgi:hypothetical protein
MDNFFACLKLNYVKLLLYNDGSQSDAPAIVTNIGLYIV